MGSVDLNMIRNDNRKMAVPAADDITCRLNVNSVMQVYSISLSALLVYAKYFKMSTGQKNPDTVKNVWTSLRKYRLLENRKTSIRMFSIAR